jgi:prepilin-type N-terminal cleavage/methylation domain-containing protein
MHRSTERGFTLVELISVIAIGAILLSLGAGALREYTRGKALAGARDMTVTQLRHAQQRTFSEGYPKAYGIRFEKGGTRWDLVRYDASAATCVVVESHTLTNGVTISSASTGTDFSETAGASLCAGLAPVASYEVALFYARGTASAGKVTFNLTGGAKTRTVSVNGATGSVS